MLSHYIKRWALSSILREFESRSISGLLGAIYSELYPIKVLSTPILPFYRDPLDRVKPKRQLDT